MKLFKSKFLSAFLVLSLVVFSSGIFGVQTARAAQMTGVKDTMSTQAISTTATHVITATLVGSNTFTTGDTIAYDFTDADFTLNAIGNWTTSDFSFNDGTPRTILAVSSVSGTPPTCTTSGANNVCVTINTTTNTFTVFPTTTGFVASGAAPTITFTINGTTATGTGTMTNKTTDVDSSAFSITETTDTATGAVAVETNGIVTVSAVVAPSLTFTVSANAVGLLPSPITTSAASTGTHTVRVGTNATAGFALSYNAATSLTGTSGTIAAYGSQASSAPGTTAGFGINLVSNATPSVGSALTQNAGVCASPIADYGTTNKFSFVTGSATTMTNQNVPADCTYTVAYVANITSVTPAGSYTVPITYVATATF